MAATERQFQAITKATVSITDVSKVRKEAELLLKPDANWEELLMPAAISVGILGELVCSSMRHKDDISIGKNRPAVGYKFITYPGSFRACLTQVSNQARDAFIETYIDFSYISEKMETIMQSFFQNAQVGKNQLLTHREKIQNESEKCRKSVQKVKDKFIKMIPLIQELLQACQNARHGYEKELNDVQMTLKQEKMKGKSVSKDLEDSSQKQIQTKGEIKEAFMEFWQSVNFSPISWYNGSSDVSDKIEMLKKQLSKMEESSKGLRQSHKEDQMNFDIIIELMKKLTKILCEIKELEMREKDLETAKKILMEGQDALGKVENQWDKMVQFFHMISNLIEFCFNWHIQESLASVEGIDQITHAFKASSVAQLVHMLSETYIQVRKNYLESMKGISGILTKEPSDPSFDSECAKTESGCAAAKMATSKLLQQNKDEFKRIFTAGLETMENMKAMQHP